MKYSKKNLERLINLTKPNTVKRLFYTCLYLGKFGGISMEVKDE